MRGGSGRGRGSVDAGGSGGVARRSRGRVGNSSGGSSNEQDVGVSTDAAVEHVDGAETIVVVETKLVDRSLDALEELTTGLHLLLAVGKEVELVAADMIVPRDGTSGQAGGRIAPAVLVAAVLVADLLVGELQAEDMVEDSAAVDPVGLRVVVREDMEGVALLEGPHVRHGW